MANIYKIKEPSTELQTNGRDTINYAKWTFDIRKKVDEIISTLEKMIVIFDNYKIFQIMPISVTYNKIVPKTSRIKHMFLMGNNPKQISAEYLSDGKKVSKIRLIYGCDKKALLFTLEKLKNISNNLSKCNFEIEFNKKLENKKIKTISSESYNKSINSWIKLNYKELKNKDLWIINDLIYIEKIEIKKYAKIDKPQIFSFLNIKKVEEIKTLLEKEGVNFNFDSYIGSEFWNLDIETTNKIIELYPFLFSFMTSDDEIEILDKELEQELKKDLEKKNKLKFNNTIIGVFDSAVKLPGYLNVVESHENLLPINKNRDFEHGTEVISVLACNDLINKNKDNLGCFKIKLFEVLPQGKILTSYLMRQIELAVKKNYKSIKVWNISIGCYKNGNKVSIFGKLLDVLQYKYDVQFIVSAGNEKANNLTSPGDSLSSISVGSVYKNYNGETNICEYSGSSKIFGFYNKPNTYEYGNNNKQVDWDKNYLYTLNSKEKICISDGTSFTTPLVTRKYAYLLEKFKLQTYTTRALINYLAKIDKNNISNLDVLKNKDEIFLFIEGSIKQKSKKEITIKLPKSNNKTEFAISYSLSYNVPNQLTLGDEYCSSDIAFRIAETVDNKRSNIVKLKKDKDSIDGVSANEDYLRKHFGKYNPNRVILDSDFLENNKKTTKNITNVFSFVVQRVDLIDNIFPEIKYGIVVHLKPLVEKCLSDFAMNNRELIIENLSNVFESEEIELDVI
ncbi:S8 family serine peptidase [Spiroplasma tabanidicola]|uniref:S8 family serine peptidase n=1 Tax=Spiroplasma tabanidicola TaxID=324079 RepID=A0A6I6C946_9MOLU|nr:S8 family serine peptidase [Spiroplasma tabanidicola]QGS51415.1 S8 family serine peptidase [Spiroplasma tabanidicola]